MTFLAVKRTSGNSAILTVIVTVVCLIPFLNKAFHIDDPLFIWSAKQIQINPVDFYGFKVNWYGTEMPMAEVTENPPVACYYIAMVGRLFGWSEIVLHTAFLVPAAAAALGMYYLSKQLCSQPVLATLAAVLTPAFLVSSTNVMCDTMMLAFWVWAAAFWVEGLKTNRKSKLFFAAVLIGICALTKYFGIALLGLLFVYSLIQKRRLDIWLLFLLIPVVILAGYQWATYALYGRGLLTKAISFVTEYRRIGGIGSFSKVITSLAFTGGCAATALFCSVLLWSRRTLILSVVLTILFILALTSVDKIGVSYIRNTNTGDIAWSFIIQLGLMAAAGVSILALACSDFWKCRDADSLLLLVWVFGTFIFAGFVNWAVNARSILPMIPAVGILLARRVSCCNKAQQETRIKRMSWLLVPAAVVALLVCQADYVWASMSRSAVTEVSGKFKDQHSKIWFEGHWGFQYYMEGNGYQAFDYESPKAVSGDIIIIPSNNSFIKSLPTEYVNLMDILEIGSSRWLTTMGGVSPVAGFYAEGWGVIPFAVEPIGPEDYYVLVVN
ncbi:MAG: glycosyltransferase family 39 protein [Phycisphaerae bacterium]|jgi:4-amino-4-deoxy-L-arabinose transferase-like glycosyltransferase